MTERVFIALGSNLGDRQANLGAAVEAIARLPHTRVVSRGPVIETEALVPPENPSPQPRYLNTVIEVTTETEPRAFLAELKTIERTLGRLDTTRWAPRTIDLDLALWGSRIVHEPGLNVPHPGLPSRRFVLEPLAAIAPDVVHPVSGKTAAQLLAALDVPARARLVELPRVAAPELPPWLAKMLPFTRYRVPVGDWAMHVMEHGEGLPVLMLHGNPSWGFLWRKVALALTGAPLRVIMPDLVGLGLSDKPRDPAVHTLDFHARAVGQLIDALGLESFVLVVQDWGGAIGGCACAERPERVRGLVVLNTVLGPPRPGFRPTAFHRFARVPLVSDFAFRVLGFPQRGMGFTQGDRSSISGDVARAYRWVLRDRRTNVAPLALARMVPDSLEHPSIARLQQCQTWAEGFRGPAAIVWGDRDPVLGRTRRRAEKLLPQAKVTATNAGHFLQEEAPEEIAAAVRLVALGR